MTGSITVHPLAVMDVAEWRFRSDSQPTWRWNSGSATTFDPFPAYAHDIAVAQETARLVAEACPPLWGVECYVADREEDARSNGHSDIFEGRHYVDGEWVKDSPKGLIVLSGKRIPPHPAVTRYLVAHEYGHNVEWMLVHQRGTKNVHDQALITEYAQMRGLPDKVHHGHGGQWHDSATEVFACDFRIVVCGVEVEFWPHPGVARPEDVPGVADWWAAALKLLAEPERAPEEVAA